MTYPGLQAGGANAEKVQGFSPTIFKGILCIFMLNIISFSGCKKPADTPNLNGQADVTVKFVLEADGFPFTLNGSNYFAINDSADTTKQLYMLPSEIKYYLTSFTMIDHNGNNYHFDSLHLLEVWDNSGNTHTYHLGVVPPGHYHFINFDLGVDAATNHANPAGLPSSSPFSLQNSAVAEMYMNIDSGYRFFVFNGKGDTTGGHSQWTQNLTYHIGTDALRDSIIVPLSNTFDPNTYDTLTVVIECKQFFTGMNIRTQTTANTNDQVARIIANNFLTNTPQQVFRGIWQ